MSGSGHGFTSPEYPFTSRWLLVRGVRMHYLDEGASGGGGETGSLPGSPVPVVMLHGNPTWSFFYRNLVKALSPGCRCIVPDHIGCGLSDKPQRYDYILKTHIDNCEFLLDSLGIKECHLVVHDWGGAIGMGMALRNPERIKRMVIMNTAAFTDRNLPWQLAFCKLPVIGELAIRQFNLFVQAARRMSTTQSGGLKGEALRGYLYPYDNFRNRVAVYRFVKDIPMHRYHESWPVLKDIEERLENLAAKPALLLWGCRDFVFTTHFLGRWKEFLPGAETIALGEAGHYLLEDEPERTNDVIRQFLDAVIE